MTTHYAFMEYPDFPEPPEKHPNMDQGEQRDMYENAMLAFFLKHQIKITADISKKIFS
jgi:hypothetical protein